ncbi:U-box domain-containing protein 12 [Phragmites australis]|uniref:U-box domain-containing protein 12 n=1 Tax=Phragmites australis TaxID=29695 RepID=UPI002D7A33CC|nr:U-box domain-containing protein 12 [Phragmites australis]
MPARVAAEIAALPEPRGPLRRLCGDLARRIRLLAPLLQQLQEQEQDPSLPLADALGAARDLLCAVHDGSKIYQAMRGDGILDRFASVNTQIQLALDDLPYHTFDMPEEVHEQVALVHSQFKRAATRTDSPDMQLSKDLSSALADKTCDPAVLTRISEKLQLQTMADMKKESVALHEMVISSGGEPDGCVEEMSSLLKKLKDCVITESPTTETLGTRSGSIKHRSPIIPDEFRCPISLELMQDPVIVSSGQTYERSCIQKWLDSGHKACPKTQQPLSHTSLTPNFVLKSLIAQWCEANGIELPKNKANSHDKKAAKSSDYDHAGLVLLMNRLRSANQDEQRAAAGEIRLLAKRNVNNRICIAEAGAIPLLVNLLSSSDPRTQEHAVTALLNLSIHENNKASIVGSNAIPKIVEVLKTGSMEARENAAATLFSLSVVDENKVSIGHAGAIPPLINLLCDGSPRGKKDAATAIFNLCIYQGNKIRAVKAGIVVHLMNFLVDPTGGMIDEALTLLAILVSNPEGKAVIAQSEPIPPLVEVIKTGSPRNRENAAAILWSLCSADVEQTRAAKVAGAEDALKELSESGTDRAKRKASSILELMRQAEEA